ncbi:hypothetical protein CDAR_577211 [Caerostris darwini]|uniref:Uncharacterized protein n=1 Tax=Caerostris darwini TaxID=1538125 RepID=A0AAV4UAE7_9ARAC|nr:hypothetical protein CDAR_577211 [Caerostris darwini]
MSIPTPPASFDLSPPPDHSGHHPDYCADYHNPDYHPGQHPHHSRSGDDQAPEDCHQLLRGQPGRVRSAGRSPGHALCRGQGGHGRLVAVWTSCLRIVGLAGRHAVHGFHFEFVLYQLRQKPEPNFL